MKQKVNLKKVATVLLSSVMMTLSSMAFTFETNGNNIALVHAEEQVEEDVEDNVYSIETSTTTIGYVKERSAEVLCSNFEELFNYIQEGQEIICITDNIDLMEPIIIPEGLNVTLVANNANGVEITGDGLQECTFFSIPTNSSLTLLGNITLTGNENAVRAFAVNGTLNLGEKDNLNEYPVIQQFTSDGGDANSSGFGGNAIYAYEATINIYNAHLINNYDILNCASGGAIWAEWSTVNFYNGEMSGNFVEFDGGAVYLLASTFNMYGGLITKNEASGDASGGVGTGAYLWCVGHDINLVGNEANHG